MTLDRLIANVMLLSIAGCAAWFLGHAYTTAIADTLGTVARALVNS